MEKIRQIAQSIRRTAGKIWNGYGYYLSVAALLLLFGAAAYLYRTDRQGGQEERYAQEESAIPVMAISREEEAPEPSDEPEPMRFVRPVPGEITRGYAPDELQWNETLGQWRTHGGVDISAPAGSAVTASESGKVLSAYEDDLWGMVIEIGHNEGYVSRYCSLGTLELVQVGMEVAKDQVISSVSASARMEASDGAHLHFELFQNGAEVEPAFE